MKAVAFTQSLPITDSNALVDIELPQPIAMGRDLLVKVKAISVNPVDYKVRQLMPPENGTAKVLGWDAVGEVVAVGKDVIEFTPGDQVFYAGDLTRQGSNAEFQLVDERLVGSKPKNLSNDEAAALPLTTITAWELLFQHLQLVQQLPNTKSRSSEVLLVVGAAGGVGSILLQLAKAITGATIIATASRESSQAWVKKLGADYVVDHSKPLEPQIEALGLGQITHVASLNSTETYFETYTKLLVPFGRIAMIDDPEQLDISQIKLKSLSLHWEFMFSRSMFNAADMGEQGKLLSRVADLVDLGYVQTTVGHSLGIINAENLREAHSQLESGRAIGKIVLEGFDA
ncbi:zinc-binding alcohol dehydrogenase family protein [Echinimonas agarilytica]|uniref:Zinc-type alcohol dehydrogenase-like protein n=1 Tax=Echinimonas agarilytica TaxID=1215918 RepID=A0AA41W3D9_9GAMM|nr:zinc-binding alcohol dehydrogenase family protein [Echinimonas agarilytica]MCM2678081.1 zinc-binding alcohol dehydrogenase family protein [Echinimonas agarilytica]